MFAYLFDIDGTLLSSGGAGQAAMEVGLARAFGITAPTEGISVAGRTDFAIITDLLDYHSIEPTAENRRRIIDEYLAHLPTELAARHGLILPGVIELLNCLSSQADTHLGLLTGNLRRGAELKLTHFELIQHFKCGGFGDDHRHRDDVARAALDDLQRIVPDALPDNLWVIGDTPADVQCGRAIGASVLAVATGLYSTEQLAATEPDYLVEDFSDVGRVLSLLT
ncbi:HAD hydrolase-like protein [bacterium]|nr:HAD hydrolase-like protein [bacterium]